MTYDKMVKKFPIGSKVILVNSTKLATKVNSIGVVTGYEQFSTGGLLLHIVWDKKTLSYYQEDGGYFQEWFEPYINQSSFSSYHQEDKKYSKCILCNSPGDDLVFKFYCSNSSCRNYHK